MSRAPSYASTLDRVEDYFDRSATKVWEQLTSDAPVSRVRATVRAGRDEMRALMISRFGDLSGKRILDAGCGTGMADPHVDCDNENHQNSLLRNMGELSEVSSGGLQNKTP